MWYRNHFIFCHIQASTGLNTWGLHACIFSALAGWGHHLIDISQVCIAVNRLWFGYGWTVNRLHFLVIMGALVSLELTVSMSLDLTGDWSTLAHKSLPEQTLTPIYVAKRRHWAAMSQLINPMKYMVVNPRKYHRASLMTRQEAYKLIQC